MKQIRKRLKCSRGMTLVELVAVAGVLTLLALLLNTGLIMAKDSYNQISGDAESQLLVSTLNNLLSNELRYARDIITDEDKNLQRYTSVNYGINTTLSLNEDGQLEANLRRMLSSGAYGNGDYRIQSLDITYDGVQVFHVSLLVVGKGSVNNKTSFSVRCLNGAGG